MQPTVLVVEDDRSVAYMLELALSQAGFKVEIAVDGLDGWEAFQRQCPDIVVSDIRMPKLDGVQLLAKIKTLEPEMDVILLTGHGELPSAIQAVELGAYRYLEKPLYQVTDLIHTAPGGAKETSACARLEVDRPDQPGPQSPAKPDRPFPGSSCSISRTPFPRSMRSLYRSMTQRMAALPSCWPTVLKVARIWLGPKPDPIGVLAPKHTPRSSRPDLMSAL